MLDLESWLRNKNMSTTHFASLVQCSRQVLTKVKKNRPIDPSIANRIIQLTDSEVVPLMRPRGGRGCEHFHNTQMNIYCNI